MTRLLAGLLTIAAVLWMAAIVFVPLGLPLSADGVAAAVYAAAGLVCHQRPERSFHIEATQLAVCARCTGLYLSGAVGALAAWLGRAHVPGGVRPWLIASAAPTAITLGVEWAGLVNPGNIVRAAAALPLGALSGWIFVRMLRAESGQTTCAMIS